MEQQGLPMAMLIAALLFAAGAIIGVAMIISAVINASV